MKKQLLIVVGCLLAGWAFAADSITVLDPSSSSSGTYAPGANVTLNVTVTGTNPPDTGGMGGYSLWMAPGSSAWNNFFTITGKTAGSTFPDQNQVLPGGGDAIVAGGNTTDLGFTVNGNAAAEGTYSGGSLTIAIGNSVAAGTYTIHTTTLTDSNSKPSEVNDGNFAGHQVASSTYTITVAAVPEPATMSLFGLGGLSTVGMALIRRRRNS